jgi:hypothetical protein
MQTAFTLTTLLVGEIAIVQQQAKTSFDESMEICFTCSQRVCL